MVIRMISSFLSSVTPIVRLKRSIKLARKGWRDNNCQGEMGDNRYITY